MKNYAALSMLSFSLLFSLLFTLSSSSSGFVPIGPIKFCPAKLTLPGACGLNGNFDCFLEWDGRCGASAMASKCRCDPAPANKHYCSCQLVCGSDCGSGAVN